MPVMTYESGSMMWTNRRTRSKEVERLSSRTWSHGVLGDGLRRRVAFQAMIVGARGYEKVKLYMTSICGWQFSLERMPVSR